MNSLNEFINDITPGNYFLTKSMEVTRVNTSGTLWYLKKFIVFYEAVFLSKRIRRPDGIESIKTNFKNYISTLPKEQQKAASDYFFSKDVDIRCKYKSYVEFAGFSEKSHLNIQSIDAPLVDKYYFMYLMGIGGQSSIKKHIKEEMNKKGFNMNILDNIVENYQRNNPDCTDSAITIINDYPASLRNERRLLFYFGFVHSRSNGTGKDTEFSSLTPIGELAVMANAKEFSLIWEHQKIKMVSQPVNIELPSIKNSEYCDGDKFKINYSPYLTILKCINKNGNLNPRFYDLVLSRTNNENADRVINNYEEFTENLERIKNSIKKFNKNGETRKEDFEKEIKKYLLGIRSDLHKDNNTNYFGCIKKLSNNGWIVTDEKKLNGIVKIYTQIENYKISRYGGLFRECEQELKRKYISTAKNSEFKINSKIKVNWDLYNIQKDSTIILSLIITDYIMCNNIELESFSDYNSLIDYSLQYFNNPLKSINLSKRNSLMRTMKHVVDLIQNDSLSKIEYDVDNSLDYVYVNKYSSISSEDLFESIKRQSKENTIPTLERKRDSKIINYLNHYYLSNYSDRDNLIKCECCGKTTFLKNNDEPYLEFHHLIPFSIADGPDHFDNIYAICPMCHRKIHSIKDKYKNELFDGFDINNHLKISIVDRLKDLYKNNILKSYQLEYALSEQIINEEEYVSILE